ncbi:MAG: TatD family hydrolase [Phycisphaerae bacterium]|nr:TatD family hydrolase [Phycisphaerae bacterium]
MKLEWIDSHVHLQDEVFAADLDEVINHARQSGVQWMVCNGTSQTDWPMICKLAEKYPAILPSFGLHPWYVKTRTGDWFDQLESFLIRNHSGVGEVGLDRSIDDPDESTQEKIFRRQLDLAVKLNRPVTVHCVRAWGWLMDILKSQRTLPTKILLHAYSGPAELIKPLIKFDAYFTFGASIFDPRREKARCALRAVPMDRLLLETGSPDVLPSEFYPVVESKIMENGKCRNEPANLPLLAQKTAEFLGCSIRQLAEQTTTNAWTFWKNVE